MSTLREMTLSELLTIAAETEAERKPLFDTMIARAKALEHDYNRTRLLLEEVTGKAAEDGDLWKLAADVRDALGVRKEK